MTPKTKLHRDLALAHIQLAQDNLYAAAQASCDLVGWADQWKAIGDAADATKKLWNNCNNAPAPIRHDYENES